jgi:hypothetical protein
MLYQYHIIVDLSGASQPGMMYSLLLTRESMIYILLLRRTCLRLAAIGSDCCINDPCQETALAPQSQFLAVLS